MRTDRLIPDLVRDGPDGPPATRLHFVLDLIGRMAHGIAASRNVLAHAVNRVAGRQRQQRCKSNQKCRFHMCLRSTGPMGPRDIRSLTGTSQYRDRNPLQCIIPNQSTIWQANCMIRNTRPRHSLRRQGTRRQFPCNIRIERRPKRIENEPQRRIKPDRGDQVKHPVLAHQPLNRPHGIR